MCVSVICVYVCVCVCVGGGGGTERERERERERDRNKSAREWRLRTVPQNEDTQMKKKEMETGYPL